MSAGSSVNGRRTAQVRGAHRADKLGPPEWLILVGWVFCLWAPVGHGALTYLFLALMTLASLASWQSKRTTPPLWFMAAWMILLLTVVAASLVGNLRHNPGVDQQTVQWFGSVVIWGTVAASFTPRFARAAVRVTLWATIFCSLLMFIYSASRLGLPHVIPSAILDFQDAGISDEPGSTAIRWYGLSTLAAGAPFAFAAFMYGADQYLPSRKITGPAALLCGATALLAGRRAILLVVVLTPVLFWILQSVARRRLPQNAGRNRSIPLSVALGALALPLVGIAVARTSAGDIMKSAANAAMTTYLGVGDTSALTLDDAVRVTQTQAMLEAWTQAPLIGHGLGASIPGFSRSETRPWLFELQYHQLLFNLGLLGVVAVLVAALLFLSAFVRAYRSAPALRGTLLASTTAGVALLIANASNPYLQAVGHGWGVALMVGSVCAAEKVGQRSSPPPAPHSSSRSPKRLHSPPPKGSGRSTRR